jgi:hypothetical protein
LLATYKTEGPLTERAFFANRYQSRAKPSE